MKKLIKYVKVIDDNILVILLSLFIFIIPLYPKIPLFIVNYTYIAVRFEDFYIALVTGVYLIQLLRKKETLNIKYFGLFFLYWFIVLLSYIWGYYVAHTISVELQKVGLFHFARRIEYMIIFFIALSSIRSVKVFVNYLIMIITSTYLVVVYGIGQKFLGLPVISTMNPEYSKGRVLELTPEARVNSTFGGHYDLAAYVVMIIPILFGVYFYVRHKNNGHFIFPNVIKKSVNGLIAYFKVINKKLLTKTKIINNVSGFNFADYVKQHKLLILIGGFFIIGLIAYAFNAAGLLIILFMAFWFLLYLLLFNYQFELILLAIITITIINLVLTESRISFFAYIVSTPLFLIYFKKYKYLVLVLIFSLLLFFSNKNIVDRFSRTFQVKRYLVNQLTGDLYIVQKNKITELPAGSSILVQLNQTAAKKISNKTQDQILEEEAAKQEIINKATKSTIKRLGQKAATQSGYFKESVGVAPDISQDIRLRVEWPRAINAFKSNIFIGSGISSITESSDNDYLRALGETGLLGFISFSFIFIFISYNIIFYANRFGQQLKPLLYAPLFSLFGLMINATYIDVFEASKIAFMLWFIFGIWIGLLELSKKNHEK